MKNKNTLFLCLFIAAALTCYADSLFAQYKTGKSKVEISVNGAYLFGGILPVTNGDLNFVNNFGALGDISFKIKPGMAVNVSYSYVPTELKFKNYGGIDTTLFKMDIHYFFLNFLYEKEIKNVVPYALFGLGGVLFDPKGDIYGSELRFATTIGGGIKLYASSKVGFKLQARLLLPLYYSTPGVFAGPGGAAYGVTSTSAVIQADISAGLIFKF
jgi:hypothetical protein